ncbi:hypothetical protein [Dyadobacter sp. NIV53]|uniref:hypothetical protein n=1 Tax=Dyadobacter sp. NIV53 TaxID=2861765 RepID=UPI001C86B130|nr:hypothetical protein [Dyadobacter sp. NIV53]
MKIAIDITKIHCTRTTFELGADEIYAAIFVTALKKDGSGVVTTLKDSKPLFGIVTDVQSDVKKGKIWLPSPNHFEVDVADDTESVGFSFALYEKDNGEIFDKMKQELTGIIEPEGFDFSQIPLTIDFSQITKILFGLLKKAVIHFKQDDLLGVEEFVAEKGKLIGDEFPREFDYKRKKGQYELGVTIKAA